MFYHVCDWCSQRPEEGIECPAAKVISHQVDAVTKTSSSAKAASTLCAISLTRGEDLNSNFFISKY